MGEGIWCTKAEGTDRVFVGVRGYNICVCSTMHTHDVVARELHSSACGVRFTQYLVCALR